MKNFIFLIAFIVLYANYLQGQSNYNEAIDQGDAALAKGDYLNAINKYFAAEAFDPSKKDIVKGKVKAVFDSVESLRKKAELAKKETQSALIKAENAKEYSDSIAFAAKQAAKQAYANELAYRSQIALEQKDRVTAFKLAEFGYNYVDETNKNINQAYWNAAYYNNIYENITNELPLGFTLKNPSDSKIEYLFVTPEEDIAMVFYRDSICRLWDLNNSMFLFELIGSFGTSDKTCYSTYNGQRLILTIKRDTVYVWDIKNGKLNKAIAGNGIPFTEAVFSPDGSLILTSSTNLIVSIWETETGNYIRNIRHKCYNQSQWESFKEPYRKHTVERLSVNYKELPDFVVSHPHRHKVFNILFSPDNRLILTATCDNVIRIWDSNTGKLLYNFRHNIDVLKARFSGDSKFVISSDYLGENTVIWSLDKGRKIRVKLETDDFALSPNGENIAIISDDDSLRITMINSDSLVKCVKFKDIRRIEYLNNSTLMLVSNNRVIVYDILSDNELMNLNIESEILEKPICSAREDFIITTNKESDIVLWKHYKNTVQNKGIPPTDLRISPDGNLIMYRTEIVTAIFKITNWEKLCVVFQKDVVFSSDSKSILYFNELDSTISIQDIYNNNIKKIKCNNSVISLVPSKNSDKIIAIMDDTSVEVYDIVHKKNSKWTKNKSFFENPIFISEDSRFISSKGLDNILRIYDAQRGTILDSILLNSEIYKISPDLSKVVTYDKYDRIIDIWDLKQKSIINSYVSDKFIDNVVFSPDSKKLGIYGSKTLVILDDNCNNLFSLNNLYQYFDFPPFIFTPDSKKIITNSIDGIYFWDLTPSGFVESNGNMKELDGNQMKFHGLDKILDTYFEIYVKLFDNHENNQTSSFADMYFFLSKSARTTQEKINYFSKAEKLYKKRITNDNSAYAQRKIIELYHEWCDIILSGERPDTVKRYIQELCNYSTDQECIEYWTKFIEKTVNNKDGIDLTISKDYKYLTGIADYYFTQNDFDKAAFYYEKTIPLQYNVHTLLKLWTIASVNRDSFDLQRFFVSNNPEDLLLFGDSLSSKNYIKEALALYKKSEEIRHNPQTLIRIYELLGETDKKSIINDFLSSESKYDLRIYGDFLYSIKDWESAKFIFDKLFIMEEDPTVFIKQYQIADSLGISFDKEKFLLFSGYDELEYLSENLLDHDWATNITILEKLESIEHSHKILIKIYEISVKNQQKFDINRFASDDPEELIEYAQVLKSHRKWSESKIMYEKSEAIRHSREAIIGIYYTSLRLGSPEGVEKMVNADSSDIEFFITAIFMVIKWEIPEISDSIGVMIYLSYLETIDKLVIQLLKMKIDITRINYVCLFYYGAAMDCIILKNDIIAAENYLKKAQKLEKNDGSIDSIILTIIIHTLRGEYNIVEEEINRIKYMTAGVMSLDDMKKLIALSIDKLKLNPLPNIEYDRVKDMLK